MYLLTKEKINLKRLVIREYFFFFIVLLTFANINNRSNP